MSSILIAHPQRGILEGDSSISNWTNLYKAVYDSSSGLSIFTMTDSSDSGTLFIVQPRSTYSRDSAMGADSNGVIQYQIVEENRPWDSANEAFDWAKGSF